MHPLLEEINQMYLPFEEYQHPTPQQVQRLTREELAEFGKKCKEASHVRTLAMNKFGVVAPELSSEELIEGYKEACRSLRANLGGHMCSHFDRAYIPIMIQGVEEDSDGAYHYLGALGKHLNIEEFAPIVLMALGKDRVRTVDTALAFVMRLRLDEAIPRVKELIQNPDQRIVKLAKEVLESLETKQK